MKEAPLRERQVFADTLGLVRIFFLKDSTILIERLQSRTNNFVLLVPTKEEANVITKMFSPLIKGD
jgi:hypothetical protein